MKRGKQTCRILKEIRKQIAEANDIEFVTSECQYQGDCLGTCPKCESEVHYLEQQLEYKRLAGKVITILGISAGLLALSPTSINAQKSKKIKVDDLTMIKDSVWLKEDSLLNVLSKRTDDRLLGDIGYQYPSFPGGAAELNEYLKSNIHYPKGKSKMSGCVIASFKVLKNGYVSHAKIIQSLHPLFDHAVLLALYTMPPWIPGKVSGKAIDSTFHISIVFNKHGVKSTKHHNNKD